jgi:hypothetical protein
VLQWQQRGNRAKLTACGVGDRIDLFRGHAGRYSLARLVKHSRCHSASCSETGEVSFSVRWAELAFHTKVRWSELKFGRDRHCGRERCRPELAATPLQPRSVSRSLLGDGDQSWECRRWTLTGKLLIHSDGCGGAPLIAVVAAAAYDRLATGAADARAHTPARRKLCPSRAIPARSPPTDDGLTLLQPCAALSSVAPMLLVARCRRERPAERGNGPCSTARRRTLALTASRACCPHTRHTCRMGIRNCLPVNWRISDCKLDLLQL